MISRVPTFETERLILRDITEADIPSYQRHFNNYEVIRYLSDRVPWPYPADGVKEFLNAQVAPHQGIDQWFWVITLKSIPDEAIGCVHLWRTGRPEHRGFWLSQRHWGKGLMTEAVSPVIEHAFQTLGFEKLVFSNALGNHRSRRIKEKTAARFIGLRKAAFVDPDVSQAETWELTRPEWERLQLQLRVTQGADHEET